MERLFEFLFKYNPIVFSRGDITLATDLSPAALVLLVSGLLAIAALLYFKDRVGLPRKTTLALASIRFFLLLILLICSLQPVIRVPTVVPQRSFVAVLVDDSQSMGITDEEGRRRIDVVRSLLGEGESFSRKLEEKFRVRWYSFARGASASGSPPKLTAAGPATDMAGAVETALNDLQGFPLSALILMSDGADNTVADFASLTNDLKARQVPLYVLGLGRETFPDDLELIKVDMPRTILQGSSVRAALTLKGGRDGKVRINVLDGQRVVTSQLAKLSRTAEVQTVDIDFTPAGDGLKHYRLSVAPQTGELIEENNRRDVTLMIKGDHPRVLYIEGEPRWEYGKLRAALSNEQNLTLTSVVRTAKDKYYRQGIESPQELITGFPKTREELYSYKGLILGSVEATYFSFDQLKMIEAFVAERGGGVLMLGGRYAYSAGGYRNTPMADLLPVSLVEEGHEGVSIVVKPAVTFNGRQHPITQLGKGRDTNTQFWAALPALTVPEPLSRTKPGAIVLLEGRPDQGQPIALLAFQRYGRGRSLAFTAADSWRWQMEMPYADDSHERFWKQLLSYLVSTAPDQVMVETDHDAYDISEPIHIRAEVNDRAFTPIHDAEVTAHIRMPGGEKEEVPLEWTPTGEGYDGQTVARREGIHTLEITARKGGKPIGVARSGFFVGDLHREVRDAQQHGELLRHLAKETGGRYYTSKTIHRLPEEITYLENRTSLIVSKDLWDMPINFLLLLGLASVEWLLRKRRGLP